MTETYGRVTKRMRENSWLGGLVAWFWRLTSTEWWNPAQNGDPKTSTEWTDSDLTHLQAKKNFSTQKIFFFTEQDFWENFSGQNFVSPENDKKFHLHQPVNTT